MSRLGVLSLVSFTLVTAIALHDRTRDGSTPEVPGSVAGGMDARMPEAASERRTSDGGDAAQAHSARPAGDDVVYRALVAFATGGLVVGLGAHWMRDRQVRRGAHPATGCAQEPAVAADIVTVHDAAGYIRYASSDLLELGGYTVHQLIGRRGRELVHPDDRAAALEALRAARHSSHDTPTRLRVQTRNDDYIWVEARFRHGVSKTGEPQFTCRATCIATSTESALALLQNEMSGIMTSTPPAVASPLARLIHESLERDEFELHYQLKVSLRSWEVAGAEALLRWNVPGGTGRTAEVIAEAERTGLIGPLGAWIVRTAAEQSRRWRRNGYDYPIAVNLSALQLRDPDFLKLVRELVSQDRQLPRYLQLEVTEQGLASNDDQTVRTIAQLAALGFVLHIDHFGRGFSKLAQLSRIPVRALKVDRKLVRNLPHRTGGSVPMMNAVSSISRSLRIKVIAAGVETSDELAAVRDYGVDEVQGFLLARPMTADSIEELSRTDTTGKRLVS